MFYKVVKIILRRDLRRDLMLNVVVGEGLSQKQLNSFSSIFDVPAG